MALNAQPFVDSNRDRLLAELFDFLRIPLTHYPHRLSTLAVS